MSTNNSISNIVLKPLYIRGWDIFHYSDGSGFGSCLIVRQQGLSGHVISCILSKQQHGLSVVVSVSHVSVWACQVSLASCEHIGVLAKAA